MKTIIETSRLILREFQVSDGSGMYVLNNDPEVLKFTGDPPFKSINDAELFIENYQEYKTSGFGRWAVICKTTNEFIGWCGLKNNEENLVDIGFRFLRKEWNKGYASEAAKATLDIGFNQYNLPEIIARTNTNNKASIRVLDKLKMKLYKTGETHGLGKTLYYKISNSDYKS